MGFKAVDPCDSGIYPTADIPKADPQPSPACLKKIERRRKKEYAGAAAAGDDDSGGKKKNVFGTKIQFVVLRNINSTGPTWTLAHFKGPGKLFSAQRTDTHSVTIGFAKRPTDRESEAAAMLQNFLTNQSALPSAIIRALENRLP